LSAVRERLVTSDAQTLLVIGLSAPERCSELVEDLQKLVREQPPAAVLFVSGRDKDQAQSQPYAAAFSL
jgi:arginine utilization protein RocB